MGRQTGAFECGPRWTNSRVEYRSRYHPLAGLVFRYSCPHMKNSNALHLPRRYLDANGESIVEHVAGIEDYQVALVTYRAACQRW